MRRRALVTGSSAGLGFAAAAALGRAGAHLTPIARRQEGLADARLKLLDVMPTAGIDTASVDLEDTEAVKRMIADQLRHPLGCPDIFIHVAGGPPLFSPGRETEADLRRFLESHSMSLWLAVPEFAPRMQEKGWGRVIAVMSRAVAEPRADNPLSAAVRLPAWALLKSYARSQQFSAVTFNAVMPGLFDTECFRDVCLMLADQQQATVDEIRAKFLGGVPAGRLGHPDELGALCALLRCLRLSQRARHCHQRWFHRSSLVHDQQGFQKAKYGYEVGN
jgi:3-oxoacyl-[acyl-carrier protein] reductase